MCWHISCLYLLQASASTSGLRMQSYLEEVMMIKKVFIILILAVVFLFSTMGSFSFSQENLHEKENISLVYASNKSGNTFFNTSKEEADADVPSKNPISKTSFAILVSSLVMMLLIKNNSNLK